MNSEFRTPRKDKIRILLITPFKIIEKCFQALIEDNQDMCVEHALNGFSDLHQVKELLNIDIVLIYLNDGDVQSVEIIPQLLAAAPEIRIVIITGTKDITNQTRAIELGAVGIVQKEQNARILIEAIRQTHKGETWINQSLLSRLLKKAESPKSGSNAVNLLKAQTITSRESEVIQLIGKGYSNKQIAQNLCISEATVRHHLSSIYSKTGVEDRLNLVIYAYQRGLLSLHKKTV